MFNPINQAGTQRKFASEEIALLSESKYRRRRQRGAGGTKETRDSAAEGAEGRGQEPER